MSMGPACMLKLGPIPVVRMALRRVFLFPPQVVSFHRACFPLPHSDFSPSNDSMCSQEQQSFVWFSLYLLCQQINTTISHTPMYLGPCPLNHLLVFSNIKHFSFHSALSFFQVPLVFFSFSPHPFYQDSSLGHPVRPLVIHL